MKVKTLINRLKKFPQNDKVYFDTEARTFGVHLVEIETAHHIPKNVGGSLVCLFYYKQNWEKASRKQLTTAPMQARKASTKTLRSCRNCNMECSINCHTNCSKPDYKYWQPRKASA